MNRRRGCTVRSRGRDLRDLDLSPASAHAAIRDGPGIDELVIASRIRHTGVKLRPATPDAYDVLGPVGRSETTVRRVVAAAARTRGETTPHDDEIRDLESELSSIEVPEPDRGLEAAKRNVVEVSTDEAELRERIAALRGRLRTERELGEPTEETVEKLEAAAAELSESSTDRIAAEQALEAAKREARNARSARNRRMKLQDRLGNLRREARAVLANAVSDEFADARKRVGPLGAVDPTAGDSVAFSSGDAGGAKSAGTHAQLAAVALADLEVPIVIDASETGITDAANAARILGLEVWLCEG